MSCKGDILVAVAVIGLAFSVSFGAPCTANWTGGQGVWDDASNWDTEVYPDNFMTGDEWTCIIDGGASWVDVGLQNSQTVSYVQTYSTADGGVHIVNWASWASLAFVTLTNHGTLELHGMEVSGNIVNNGSAEMEMEYLRVTGNVDNFGDMQCFDVDMDGDFTNRAGAQVEVEHMLEVEDGTFTNDGTAVLTPFGSLDAFESLINNNLVLLYGGECSSGGTFVNNGRAQGGGFLHSGTQINNAGVILSENADLTVHTGGTAVFGTVINAGSLGNSPGTSLHVMAASVDHTGVIEVNSQGAVTFTCDLTNPAGAEISLSGGALSAPNVTNQAGASFSGFGQVAGNLTNQGNVDFFGDSQIVGNLYNEVGALLGIRNGDLLIVGDSVNDGTMKAYNGQVFFEGGLINNGEINIDPAVAVFAEDLQVTAGGIVVADGGSELKFLGDFDNGSAQRTTFDLSAAKVRFSGFYAAGPQQLEAGGKDFGESMEGYADNFAMGALLVEAGKVQLVDVRDNRPDWAQPEAVYVGELAFGPGGTIEPDGLHLYYLNGAQPKQFFVGDANLDGAVDGGDYTLWADSYGQPSDWYGGDFNGDGVADGGDYTVWADNYGAGAAAAAVPEPGVLSALAVAALALIRRRRR